MSVSNKLAALWLLLLSWFGGHVVDFPLKEKVGVNVVYLEDPAGMFGGGTGFTIQAPSGKRYIMTNRHVCQLEMGGYLNVRHGDFERGTLRKVLRKSLAHDLCIVQALPQDRGAGLELAEDAGSLWDRVTVVGHPDLLPLVQEDGQLIGEKDITVEYSCEPEQEANTEDGSCEVTDRSLMITNKIRPGNSGSPLVNSKGQVIGVIYAGNGVYGIAVPLRFVKAFLKGW